MRHFIFCHGFGFNNNFWCKLTPYFSQERCTYLDLGYFNNPSECIADSQNRVIPAGLEATEEACIGIGHSLGLLKLLNTGKSFDCIVGLNSFVNFLGNDPALRNKRNLELELLKQHFIQSPLSTLKRFYKRCGVPSFINQINKEKINTNRLRADLKLLKLNITPPAMIPILIMASEDDEIVPKALVHDNFDPYTNVKIEVTRNGKHRLGLLEVDKLYEKIMSFINDSVTNHSQK